MSAGSEQTEPASSAPPTPPSESTAQPAMPSMAAFGGNERCPNCAAAMAPDQRYCLNCGHRRGEPRLPFMDAVSFMESMNAPTGGAAGGPPPPPPERKSPRMNANAALIAGVATLVLAIGVGFLIGRVGHENGNTQAQAPQIIKVEGGGGGGGEETAAPIEEATEEAATPTTKSEAGGKKKGGGAKPAIKAEGNKGTPETEENAAEGAHGQSQATEETLHTAEGIELESEVEVGGTCKEGTAGCEGGKFEGNFFE